MRYGKVCLASRVDGIPEVAGDLVPYFDPHLPEQTYNLVLQYFSDPALRAQAEERVRRNHRPHSWDSTAQQLITVLEQFRSQR